MRTIPARRVITATDFVEMTDTSSRYVCRRFRCPIVARRNACVVHNEIALCIGASENIMSIRCVTSTVDDLTKLVQRIVLAEQIQRAVCIVQFVDIAGELQTFHVVPWTGANAITSIHAR